MLSSELWSDISVSSEIPTLSFLSFLCQSGLGVAHLRTLKLMKNQSGSQKEKVSKLVLSLLLHLQNKQMIILRSYEFYWIIRWQMFWIYWRECFESTEGNLLWVTLVVESRNEWEMNNNECILESQSKCWLHFILYQLWSLEVFYYGMLHSTICWP